MTFRFRWPTRSLAAFAALCVCIGLSALAPGAQASGGPQWFVAGKVLTSGVSSEAFGIAELIEVAALEVTESTIICRDEWLGEIHGGEPGTDSETITLFGCELEHSGGCEPSSPAAAKGIIEFSPTDTKLVYLNVAHTEVGDLYTAHTNPLAKIELGTHCPIKTTFELTGSSVARMLDGVGKYQIDETQEYLASGTKYEYWDPGTSKWISATSKLELGGLPSRLSGVVSMELKPRLEFKVE